MITYADYRSVLVVARVLSAYCRWADPVVIDVNAALQDHVDHLVAAKVVMGYVNASLLPCFDHFVATDPLVSEQNAVMGWLVEVQDILEAEFKIVMLSAKR